MKISDLMDHLQDDSVSLREQDVVSAETVQAAVSAKLREQSRPRRSGRTLRILLVAAVLTVLLSFGVLAEEQYLGIQSRPEYKAAMELYEYEHNLSDDEKKVSTYDSGLYTFGIRYEGMEQKLVELADRYGLTAPTNTELLHGKSELYEVLGTDSALPTDHHKGGTAYLLDTGSLTLRQETVIEGYSLDYNFELTVKGTAAPMEDMMFFFYYEALHPEHYMIEQYTTADGSKVLLGMAQHLGFVIANQEHTLMSFMMAMSTIPQEQRMEVLQAFAEKVDFTALDKLGE